MFRYGYKHKKRGFLAETPSDPRPEITFWPKNYITSVAVFLLETKKNTAPAASATAETT